MSYTVIAQENILMANATSSGSKEERTFVILERFSEEETVTEIGISGDPLYIMGSRGNDIFFPFNPIQIQLTIVDQFGLRKKFANRNMKDFKLQVKDGETVEFELYLYLPSNNSEYFETSPEIELVAISAFGLLKQEYFKPTDTLIELKDFLFQCLDRIGFDFDIEVYSLWSSVDNAKTFPLGYRVNRSHQVRFEESDRVSFYQVLENFCEQFNLQLYQVESTWVFLERKIRLNAPTSVSGVDLSTELPVYKSLATILNSDTVLRSPRSQFKPGLKEIQTEFKLFGEGFKNLQFKDSNLTNRTIANWLQAEPNFIEVIESEQVQKIFLTEPTTDVAAPHFFVALVKSLNLTPADSGIEDYYKGSLAQKSEVAIYGGDRINFSWDITVLQNSTNAFEYIRISFIEADSLTTHWLNNDFSTWTSGSAPNSPIEHSDFSSVDFSETFSVEAPGSDPGFLKVEFICTPKLLAEVDTEIKITDFSIDIESVSNAQKKLIVNSRGLRNPISTKKVFGVGDQDLLSAIFVYEYYDSNNNWVIAESINNDGSGKSVFELAPYQRLCQANKDQIEYSNIRTWKYLYPYFYQTILFDKANEYFLYTIPIEVKWNMVTGELEIYSAEAFEDTTGITQLQFYSEEEYASIDEATIIADDGKVFYGFTKGGNSQDDRGFEVEFNAPNDVTNSSAVIEVDGVNYELDTIILEE